MKETNELERIIFKKIGQSILEVLNLERDIFYSIYALLIRPGEAIEGYLNRDRKKMMKPVRFLLVILTFTTIVFLNYGLGDYVSGFLEGAIDASKNEEQAKRLIDIFYKYCNLFLVFLLPLTSFFSWKMFNKSDYNGAEHLVISIYVFSFQSLIFIAFTLGLSLFQKTGNVLFAIIQVPIIFILSTFFQIYFYFRLFKQGVIITIFKGFLIIFFSFTVYLILFSFFLFVNGVR